MFESLYFEYTKVFTFIVVFIACDAYCKMRSRAIYFPHVASLSQEGATMTRLLLFLRWFGVVMLILALMSPVKDQEHILAPSEPRAFVYVIDTSMRSFENVKSSLALLIENYKGFEQGIVAFDKSAYVVSPLTTDAQLLISLLKQIVPQEGSMAQEDAYEQMRRLFKAAKLKNRIAMVFSDDINRSRSLKKQFASEKLGYYFFNSSEVSDTFLSSMKQNEPMEKMPYTFKEYYYIYPLFLSFMSFLLYVYLRNRRSV